MSKQQDAPGELERVRAFVNTADLEEGTDALGTPTELARWLHQQGLTGPGIRARRPDLDHALELREALRAVMLSHNHGEAVSENHAAVLDAAACRARVGLRFDEQGSVTLQAEAPGVDGALGRLLTIIHNAVAEGTWPRLKACRDHDCEWAFYDHTKNRSGAWCNMAVCGNRAKARAYRERHGEETATA